MTEPPEDVFVRRHLTSVRRLVLDIIAAHQPISLDEIVSRWATEHPTMSARHRAELPRMSGHVLWRLENLGWIQQGVGGYRVTPDGQRALDRSHAAN